MFSITESPELKVWFTTDWHLGHQKEFIWKARGYTSAEHHTQSIIDITNQYVREGDILFNLGDLCLNTSMEQLDRYLDQIVCRNVLCLWGNHNNPHEKTVYRPERDKVIGPGVRFDWIYPVRYKNITYLGHYHEVVVNKQLIILSHYAFQIWNERHNGSWCLCGHSHGSLPTTRPESSYGKILDVGWDLFHKPLSFSEIKDIMDKKPIQKVDHH